LECQDHHKSVILTLSKAEGEGSAFLEGEKKAGPSPSALLRVRMTISFEVGMDTRNSAFICRDGIQTYDLRKHSG